MRDTKEWNRGLPNNALIKPVATKNATIGTDVAATRFQSIVVRLLELDMSADIEKNFVYHPPKDGQPERYAKIRAKAKELAELIDAECPQSRERSIAMTDLENSVMWANAAIARNE